VPPVPARDPGTPRLGFCRSVSWPALEPACQALLEQTAAALSAKGATVADVALPAELGDVLAAQRRIMCYEAARNYAYEKIQHADRLSPALRAVLAEGDACSFADYVAAIATGERLRDHLDDVLGRDFDALITPSALGAAPAGLDATGDPQCNAI